jgi:hypothetical protein
MKITVFWDGTQQSLLEIYQPLHYEEEEEEEEV